MKARKKPTTSPVTESNTISWSHWLLVSLVLLLGAFVRFFWLTTAPKGALIDEAHFGYIAYSLLETGKDEHGVAWPLVFRGFGDQKLPGYAYALLPFVKIFGLNHLAIRLPSVLAGTGLMLVLYWLARSITKRPAAGLFAMLVTAVSPWPFFLSRFGFESNLGLFFFSLGLLGLVHFAEKQSRWLLVSAALSLAVSLYCYVAFRPVVLVLLVFYAGWLVWKQTASRQNMMILLITFGVAIVPLLLPSTVGSNATRFKQVGILSDKGVVNEVNENRTFCSFKFPSLLCYALWNKPSVVLRILTHRYFYTFSPQYLVTDGEDGINFLTVTHFGQISMFLYPFFVMGVFFLATNPQELKLPSHVRALLLAGLLLAPIPTLVVGDPQKVRLSSWLPFVIMASVYGVTVVWLRLRAPISRLFLPCFAGLLVVSSGYYFVNYYAIHTVRYDYTYQSFLPELYSFLRDQDPNYTVYLHPFYSDPLMFFAYYTKMDPAEYQKMAVLGPLEDSGFQHTVGLGRYKVKQDSLASIGCQAKAKGEKALYVTNEPQPNAKSIRDLRSENGALVYAFVYDATVYTQMFPELCKK